MTFPNCQLGNGNKQIKQGNVQLQDIKNISFSGRNVSFTEEVIEKEEW